MAEAPGEGDAERVLMELVTGPASRWQPLDQVLDGPCLRVYFVRVPLALRLGRRPDGRLICTGLLVGWDDSRSEINGATLRSFALGAVLAEVARLAKLPPQTAGLAVGVGGRYRQSDYALIAERYRAAKLSSPTAPTKWLASTLGVGRAQASRVLRECRRRGLVED